MITIQLCKQNEVLAEEKDENLVTFVLKRAYQEKEYYKVLVDEIGYYWVQFEDTMPIALVNFKEKEALFPIPSFDQRLSYSFKSFVGERHAVCVFKASEEDRLQYRNVALNPYDFHENSCMYPHSSANVETRNEAVFASRNAINGNCMSKGHGKWPFESWGINQREDAEIRIDFSETMLIDKLKIVLRADFPHDNWWEEATFVFSNSEITLQFQETGLPQMFEIMPTKTDFIIMKNMKKCATNPSPFPALVQIECWGKPIQ